MATVDAEGVVTAGAEGQTTIIASLGNDVSSACDVKVLHREIGSFELVPITMILKVGETQRMTASDQGPRGRRHRGRGPGLDDLRSENGRRLERGRHGRHARHGAHLGRHVREDAGGGRRSRELRRACASRISPPSASVRQDGRPRRRRRRAPQGARRAAATTWTSSCPSIWKRRSGTANGNAWPEAAMPPFEVSSSGGRTRWGCSGISCPEAPCPSTSSRTTRCSIGSQIYAPDGRGRDDGLWRFALFVRAGDPRAEAAGPARPARPARPRLAPRARARCSAPGATGATAGSTTSPPCSRSTTSGIRASTARRSSRFSASHRGVDRRARSRTAAP